MKNKILIFAIIIISSFLPLQAFAWDEYFDNADFNDVKMSPDGQHLGVITVEDGKRMLAFYNVKSSSVTGGVQLPGKFEVGPFFWATNERVVMKLWRKAEDKKEHEYEYTGELFAIDIDGKRSDMIYGVRSGEMQTGSRIKKKQAVEAWAKVIDALPARSKHILISSELMTKTEDNARTLYLLDVTKGTTSQRITSAPIKRAEYFTDGVGNVKAAVGIDKDFLPQLYIRRSGSWEKMAGSQPGTKFQVVDVDQMGQYLYAIDNDKDSKASIYRLDLSSGEYKKIYTHDSHDVAAILLSLDGSGVYGVRLSDANNTHVYLKNVEDATLHKTLSDLYPGMFVTITETSPDSAKSIVKVGSNDNPGEFYLYDQQNKELKRLTSSKAAYTVVWKNPMKDPRNDDSL